jgi:4-amino-4-deoxy-L-arabinose transferase-like glycosyltransferase
VPPTVQLRPVNRPVITLLLLAGLTLFLGLGRQAITDSDEGFYAEAAREMVEGGDWLTPHYDYVERWQKPALYYWVAAGAMAATGSTEFAARFGAALSGMGLVLLTWAAARRLTARDDAAWIAGAIAATCYGYFAMARSALPDLPLAFFITATIWSTMRAADPIEKAGASWAALAGLAAGLGFLTKGPLAVVIPVIVLLPIWWRERRTLAPRTSHLVLAAVVFALSGLPWYVAMTYVHGTPYLKSFFLADNLERFATTRFNDQRAIWFYVPIVVGGLMPWAIFLLVLPWRTLRDVARRRRSLTDVEWRLAIWTLAPLLLFTASIGKQPRYILPVLPPLAMMLGLAIANRVAASGGTGQTRFQASMLRTGNAAARRELSIATLVTSAMFVLMAMLLYRVRSLFISAHPLLTVAGIVAVACAGLALAWVTATRAWTRLPIVMALSAATLLLTLQFGAFAGRRPEAVEELAAMIQANRHGHENVGEYDAFVRNLVFYTRFKQVQVFDDAGALAFLRASDRVLLVVHREDLDRLKMMTDMPLNTLGAVTYLNTASVRLSTLLSPVPDQDLETVVVVSNR